MFEAILLVVQVILGLIYVAVVFLFGMLYVDWVQSNKRVINDNYLTRYFIIPRNLWFNIYLHKFTGDDDDRALHDHPWWSVSFLLKGGIREWVRVPGQTYHKVNSIRRFIPKFRTGEHAHRIEMESDVAWTLFITGPAYRQWGFLCPNGWVHWKQFTDETGNNIGRGCD